MSLQGFSYANLGLNIGPFQLNIEQKLPKMINYISNLQFGEHSVKIRPKIESYRFLNSHLDANIRNTCKSHVKLYTDNLLIGMEILFI